MILKVGRVRINTKSLIYFVLTLTLVMGTLTDDFGIPSAIRYMNDAIIIILFLFLLKRNDFLNKISFLGMNAIFIAMILFSVVNIITVVINFVPLNLVLWAVRNTYRFLIFFWACVLFLDKDDLNKIFEFFYWLQWVNFLLVLYQFFGLGLKQDSLGGIFGHGGNAGLLVYSVILLAHAISKFISKEYSMFRMLFVLVSTCFISVLAEIRVFFVMALIIIMVNFFLNRNIMRKTLIMLGLIVLFFIAIDIYKELFPYVTLSIEALLEEGNSTGGGYNISRLNAFSDIKRIFFKEDLIHNLFGYGFGNCEYSTIPLFCSEFYREYGSFNYRWFTNQWIFLETGYAGIITYLIILCTSFVYSFKCYRKVSKEKKSLIVICIIMCIVCIISVFYNSLLKADYGYIAFFAMAIAGIVFKGERKNVERVYKEKDL